ncbi:MAG: insulinase family protein [Cyanobacterium sp. T60_A2020_053]|nr:insulinase family protein [Cyanobacterium sp. T60_A2020_053]
MTLTIVKQTQSSTPTITKLSNGLTIIAQQMPVDAINFNVWFNVGSLLETDHINGMAHFLEHMIFKGSQRLMGGEFERIVEGKGAVTNAATSQEYTHFYVTCAPQDLAELAPLQLDLVLNPSLPLAEFEREKLVVLEEIRRALDNRRRLVFERGMKICFPNLPYSRPILGTQEVVGNITRQQMADFHHSWYQPSAMTVNAVGNLPVEELTAVVEKNCRHLSSQPSPHPVNHIPELPFQTIVRDDYTDVSLQQSRLMMMWRAPGLNNFRETLALDVLAVILGQGKLSRLYRDLRETRHLVKSISANNMTHKIQGVFSVACQLNQENLAQVEEEIITHIKDIQNNGVNQKELQRVSTLVANQFIFHNEKPSDIANLYGYYYSQMGDLQPAFTYADQIRSLTVADIQEASVKYLTPHAYGIVTVKGAG